MTLGRRGLWLAALGLIIGSGAAAQTPDSVAKRPAAPKDTVVSDTLKAKPDSLRSKLDSTRAKLDTTKARSDTTSIQARTLARRDSLAADSIKQVRDSVTRNYIRLQDRVTTRVPVVPRLGDDGPQPAGSRLVFTRDSLTTMHAESVADLLQRVPGAYVWRGGWLGRPEYGNFRGRGAAAIEYYLDGVPYLPAGFDSTAVDGSLLALSLFERVEIETWPTVVRIYMYTTQNDRLATRTHIDLGTGNAGLTRFSAALERGLEHGVSFTLAADYLNSAAGFTDASTYRNTQLLARIAWMPTPRYGIQLEYLRGRPVRPAYTDGTQSAGIDSGFALRRSDTQLRGFWRARNDGYGLGFDLIGIRTLTSDTISDTLPQHVLSQSIYSAMAVAALRSPLASLSFTATTRSRWTKLDLQALGAVTSVGPATLSAEARYQIFDASRTAEWAGGKASVVVLPNLTLTGSARLGRVVGTPSIATDTAQNVREFEGGARFAPRRWLSLYGTVTRTAAYNPTSYQEFVGITLLPVPTATWVTGGARFAPLSWLSVDTWASTPVQGTVPGQPPRHIVTIGTIHSKFLRTFKSGILDLRASAGLEFWDAGVLGVDATGAPVSVPRTSHVFTQVQLQLSTFTIYFLQQNTTGRDIEYVPGFRIPAYASSFGLRWGFSN